MEATQANLEPIFLLYEGGNGAATRLVDEVADSRVAADRGRAPPTGCGTGCGRSPTQPSFGAIAADLAPRTALIADGHHRYAAYLQLRSACGRPGPAPGPGTSGWRCWSTRAAYPPQLGAIHRVIVGLMPEAAARLAATAFSVSELPGGSADVPAALAALAEAEQERRGVPADRQRPGVPADRPRPAGCCARPVPDQPAELWQQLPAAVLAGLLFARIWGIEDDARSVQAIHDAAAAIQAADDEPGGTAVICSPMSAAQVYQVAALGRRVPRKSTSFGPKPRTGLVMRLFAQS